MTESLRARRTAGHVARRLKSAARLWRLYLVQIQIRLAPSEAQRLFFLTMGIGVLCGLAAVAFHLSIELVQERLVDSSLHTGWGRWIMWAVLTPVLGALVCGILLQYVFPNARGSGIPQVKAAFARTPAVVPARDAIGKFLVGTLQIGSGSSLGREGPTVQICAGISSWLGRIVAVTPKTQRRLLPVGVAAGIAAAFNAPIAAVTFTIEEVVGSLDQAVLSGVIVAAAVAAVIERGLLGESPVFNVPGTYGLEHASSLLLYTGIGLAAALAAIVFTESLLWLRGRMQRMSRFPAWMRPAIGAGATGILAVVGIWALKATGITGGGYATLGQVLNGQLAWQVLLGLSVLKLAATVLSYSSGGAGGVFAPCLFIGGTLGGAIGALDATWLGHADEPIGAFALVGMGAMFAGVIRAPMTSVLIIIEMTRGYSLILPLMIANMTAYGLARRFRPGSLYEALLEQDGIHIARAPEVGDPIRVGSLLGTERPTTLLPNMTAAEVLLRCGDPESTHVYPVLDEQDRLLGIVTRDELGILQSSQELHLVATAWDLMRPAVSVRADDEIALAVKRMLESGLRELPVTDPSGIFVGFVDDAGITESFQHRKPQVALG